MKIYIHIGFPKTGTTAIQSHITCNWNWLAKRGVYIPKAGYLAGLGHCFLFGKGDTNEPPNEIAHLLSDTSAIPNLADEIQACDEAGFRTVLLTWEGFCMLDRALIRRLKICFESHQVTLFSYVRVQSELTQSLLLQAIKTTRNTETVFSYMADDTLACPWYLDFFSALSIWREEFGDQLSIRTKVYERNLLLKSDVVQDFIDWLGLEIDDHFAIQGSDVNHSLDYRAAVALGLARALGLDARGMQKLSRALSKSPLLKSGSQKRFLPKSTMDRIRDSHIDSNIQFLEHFQPENMNEVQSREYFSRSAAELTENEDPLARISKELYSIVYEQEREIWHGHLLVGHDLSKVTVQSGTGWRQSEKPGIWSVGDSSEIAFKIPAVNSIEGPVGLKLTLTGEYFGENESTLVSWGGAPFRVDLRDTDTVLHIPIDVRAREEGICLKLSHDTPVSPLELGSGKSSDRLAFQLRYIVYDFYWEEDYLR